MKKIFIILILSITSMGMAQSRTAEFGQTNYVYTELSFDANTAFGIKELERTAKKDRGFDWDLELGARDRHVGVYLFYGRYDRMNYQIYGVGTDYYIQWLSNTKVLFFDGVDLTLGLYYSSVMRQDVDDNWGAFQSWVSPKIKTIAWVGDFSLSLQAKWQGRPDIGKRIFEGSLGVGYRFKRRDMRSKYNPRNNY